MYQNRCDEALVIFLVLATTYGLVSWRNISLAGGFVFLIELWNSGDGLTLEKTALDRWLKIPKWYVKGYNTNVALSKLHPDGK